MAGKRSRMTNAQIEAVLLRGLAHAESVSYKVSLRWVFYKLLQEGFYSEKGDYAKWCGLCAIARKEGRLGWEPSTLADNTRHIIHRAAGQFDFESAVMGLVDNICDDLYRSLTLDHFYQQKRYVELWFESKGMAGQFEMYTKGIDLVPFGGDPSISLKWDVAKNLEKAYCRYDKPITILYFGDYDTHGLEIPDSAESDIMQWCNSDFNVERCGITPAQAAQYNVPENPDRPGQYQWAALPDAGAKEIIQTSVAEYLDVDLIDEVEAESDDLIATWDEKIRDLLEDI